MTAPSQRPRVVAIIQARYGSTRLPGKVLAPVGPLTMLERLLSQLRGARTLDLVVVATSNDPSDDVLAERLAHLGVEVHRGSLADVLGRYRAAADRYGAEVVVRLTGDCPLLSPDTVDEVVEAFLADPTLDYASNNDPYTRPDGQDVEVFSRKALELAAREAGSAADREHVTLWLRRARQVKRLHHSHRTGPHGGRLRWTVDDPADLAYVTAVWARLDSVGAGPHSYETIMRVVEALPEGAPAEMANRGLYKSWYDAAPGTKAPPLRLAASEAMLERSSRVIPGGAQTYSKSWRQHIRGVSPIFLERGAGARVWDVDGNEYVDLIQGLLPNILGYAHERVDKAAYQQAQRGHSFSLAHPLEVELAERLVRLIPCAEMVRFGKNGSDATAGAVRAARAFTRREHVAVCGYHGWQDWFIGTTTRSGGVPKGVRALSHQFKYNDPADLERLLSTYPGQFAAVVMEPVTFYWPAEGYLAEVKKITHRHGALLIFDEICTGFHMGLGGAQERFGVLPDIAAFGKAMGNGYAISCIVGRREVMQVFDDVFVSFTFAGDAMAMAAAMAVLDELEHGDAYQRMAAAGQMLRDGFRAIADASGLGARLELHGHPNWTLHRWLDAGGQEDPVLRALVNQEVTRRGVLILSTQNVCAALDLADVEHVLRAFASAAKYAAGLVNAGEPLAKYLDGPVPTPAFRVRG
jgi:glutamate-1-semialdehyde aminotransferase/spore coat polysaccharide biosynthesis protein SpsF (cytidylyltransferase family)